MAHGVLHRLAPGIAVAFGLAAAAQFAANGLGTGIANAKPLFVSPALLGLLFGILCRRFVERLPNAQVGIQWILGTALRVGIALVGLRLTLKGFTQVAPIAMPVIVICMAAALFISRVVGRVLGLSRPLQQLLAVGSAVCGCTAIIAATPVLKARPAESAAALTCVVLIGSCGAILYPWLAAIAFDGRALPVGVFLGSAIHDTSQVVAAALIYAQQWNCPEVVGIASATKLFRNLAIVVLVPFMAWQGRVLPAGPDEQRGGVRFDQAVPRFVIWFVALVFVRGLGDRFFDAFTSTHSAWLQLLTVSQSASDLLLTCGITALGLSISMSQVRSVGPRAVIAALTIAAVIALCSLALTYTLFSALAP